MNKEATASDMLANEIVFNCLFLITYKKKDFVQLVKSPTDISLAMILITAKQTGCRLVQSEN